MFSRLLLACRLVLPALILICFFSTQVEAVYSKSFDEKGNIDLRKPHTFSILACVTWWSHDAVGYHPAMSLFLENISGRQISGVDISNGDRSGEEIPFQGRFTDIRSGEVTVAREYRRGPIRNHERFPIVLRGPQSYDLPIDSSLWPSIECKAMCRVSDSEPEDLFLGHLARITMSDEDAQGLLVAQAGRSPLLMKANNVDKGKLARLPVTNGRDLSDGTEIRGLPARAPVATAYGGNHPHQSQAKALNESTTNNKLTISSLPKSVPTVGDDFYAFEKLYGAATEFQAAAGGGDLTWTHYKSKGLITDIFVGSHNANKADVVILSLSSSAVLKDKDLLLLGKQLARCNKSDAITPFSHSVRYSAAGRFEFMTTAIREYRLLSFKVPSGTVLAVSRLPGDIEASVANYGKRVNFLNFIEAD